jgi:hypothetical protein
MPSFIVLSLAIVGLLTVLSCGALLLLVVNDHLRRKAKHLARTPREQDPVDIDA